MKKILLFIIAGVIGLTSCVQSEESESVVALRKAKADQLTSMAALNNANAQAAIIVAEAQATIAAAQAAYQEALAAYQEALAAKEIANAEAIDIQNEIAKATMEAQIKAALAQAEADLALAKVNYERQMADLQALLDAAEDADRVRILALMDDLDEIVRRMNNANADLLTVKADLARAENGLITAQEAKDALILANTKEIKANNALIEAYGDPSQSSRARVQEMLNDYQTKLDKITAEYDVALANYRSVSSKVAVFDNNMWDFEKNDRLMLARGHCSKYYSGGRYYTMGYYVYGYAPHYGYDAQGREVVVGYDYTIDYSSCLEDSTDLKESRVSYTYEYGGTWYDGGTAYWYCGADSTKFDAMIAAVPTSREYILAQEKLDTAEARCARYLDSSSHPDGNQIRDLMIAVDTMTARWNRNHTDYNKMMVENAEADLADYIENCNLNVVYFQNNVDMILGKVDDIKEVRAWYTGKNEAEYQKMIAEYLKLIDDLVVKYDKYMDLDQSKDIYTGYVDDLTAILAESGIDVAAEVAALQARNIVLQKEIDDYSQINTQEELIAQYTAEIAVFEASIEVYQAQYDAVRAQIEALMGKE